jgi:sugar fermentation stimulation protein A
MRFASELIRGTLVRRYKRFLADVKLADGTELTVHCANTGAMLGCQTPGATVWLSRSENPRRKYPFSWELVEVDTGTLVGINTSRTNHLAREAIEAGLVPQPSAIVGLRAEVPFGHEGSRVDFLLSCEDGPCTIEVKNVTAAVNDGIALFPDAVSERGSRHLRELKSVVASGERATLLFCVQREDVHEVRPADDIDPVYGRTLREARDAGVELLALRARVSTASVELCEPLPVVCP